MSFPLTEAEIRTLFDAIHEREMVELRKQLLAAKKTYSSSMAFDINLGLDKR